MSRCYVCDPPKRAELCEKHLQSAREADIRERIRRAMTGMCNWCSDDAEPNRSYCKKHLEKARESQRRYAARVKAYASHAGE